MLTTKSIAAGEEIFNDYGEMPRSDLLRRYGYVTDNYKKFDVVELYAPNIIQSAKDNVRCLKQYSDSKRVS